MSESKRGWYVLRAISGKEAKVKEVLDAQIKNTDLGNYLFQVLIPTEKVMTVRNGKKIVKERNLYSGYVFIEADLCGEVIHQLSNTTSRKSCACLVRLTNLKKPPTAKSTITLSVRQ